MYKITGVTVKDYNFTATIEDSELNDYIISQLGLKRDPDYITEIQVEGSFTVSNPDSDPTIELEGISLIGTKTGKTFKGPLGYNVLHCDIETKLTVCVPQWGDVPIYNTVDLDLDKIDVDSLCDDILDQGDIYNWIEDYNASLCDYYYDSYMDR